MLRRITSSPWLYLSIAIALEVGGTITMKAAHLDGVSITPGTALVLMYVLIGLSYTFLALAVTKMPVGVAYAFWEGLGLTIITLISVTLLGEEMTWLRFAALMAIVAGAVLIHHGTSMSPKKVARPPLPDNKTKTPSTKTVKQPLKPSSTPSYGRAM